MTSEEEAFWPAGDGVYGFRARDRLGNQGTYPASAQAEVTLDQTPPDVVVTGIVAAGAYAHAASETVYYNPTGAGTFTVTVQANDTLAGLDEITFPDTISPGGSYDYDGQTGASRGHVYDFDENDTFSSAVDVVAVDRATNDATATFTVTRDADAPVVSVTAGGAPTITVGLQDH